MTIDGLTKLTGTHAVIKETCMGNVGEAEHNCWALEEANKSGNGGDERGVVVRANVHDVLCAGTCVCVAVCVGGREKRGREKGGHRAGHVPTGIERL